MTISLDPNALDIFSLETGGITLDTGRPSLQSNAPAIALDGVTFGDDEYDMPSPEDAEAEALGEVNEVLAGFKDRANREDQRFVDATDSEYWVAVCFQTREQKDEFLRKTGWEPEGDKYLDGMAIARIMGIPLEARIPVMPQLRTDSRLAGLT